MKERIRWDRLTIFGLLWAFHALVQELRSNGVELWFYDNDPLGWLQLASIVALFRNPRSLYMLLTFLALNVVELSVRMPINSVHVTLEYLFSVLFLLGIVLALVQPPGPKTGNQSDTVDYRESIFDYIAPFVRVSLILFYSFVVLQKLNWDFLDYFQSCAPHLYEKLEGGSVRRAWIPLGLGVLEPNSDQGLHHLAVRPVSLLYSTRLRGPDQ